MIGGPHRADGEPVIAGLIVANTGTLGAVAALWLWVRARGGARGRPTAPVRWLAVFPFSFFLSTREPEGHFFLLVALSLLADRRGQWPLAGVWGSLAAATRPMGVLLLSGVRLALLGGSGAPAGRPARESSWAWPSSPAPVWRRTPATCGRRPAGLLPGARHGLGGPRRLGTSPGTSAGSWGSAPRAARGKLARLVSMLAVGCLPLVFAGLAILAARRLGIVPGPLCGARPRGRGPCCSPQTSGASCALAVVPGLRRPRPARSRREHRRGPAHGVPRLPVRPRVRLRHRPLRPLSRRVSLHPPLSPVGGERRYKSPK